MSKPTEMLLVKLRRGKRKAILLDTGGRLFTDGDKAKAAINGAFGVGWRHADIDFLYPMDDDVAKRTGSLQFLELGPEWENWKK